MDKSFEIAELIYRKIRNTIDDDELGKLEQWQSQSPDNRQLFDRLTDPSLQLQKADIYEEFNKERVWSAIQAEVFGVKTRRMNPSRSLRIAASILLPVLATAGFLLVFLGRTNQTQMASIDEVFVPGSSRAVLVLADGGEIELEDESAPSDIRQGEVDIRNENKSLTYKPKAKTARRAKPVFNELKTPRGGGYNLVLADGTEVWLNAGSSLRFPVSFTDSTRQVYLEGEGYFKVSHNGKPFIVSSGEMDVRVLGTSFNISAYEDDSEIVTTLVEGKVRIDVSGNNRTNKVSEVLTPNKQALLNKYLTTIRIEEVDIEQYTSWMQGKLEFDNENLEAVMKRLSRWYDFDYEFENTEAREYHFSARISNSESISTILEMLEMTTDVKFELRKNTIVVL